MNILVVNGPNLNLLGQREPKIYGKETLQDILDDVFLYSKNHNINVEAFQSNHEGEIVLQHSVGRRIARNHKNHAFCVM